MSGSPLECLYKWAKALQGFCRENDMPLKTSSGSVGAQFLRDKRFYPDARRKVPMVINERAREHLPGNHYQLLNHAPSLKRDYTVHYLDQRMAHHYHAANTPLPDSNSLYAYGSFVDLEDNNHCTFSPDFHGLYCLTLCRPVHETTWTRNIGTRYTPQFVWSNEIPFLTDNGYTIDRVIAAWGSKARDKGLPRFARWVQDQSQPAWAKPIYLSAYGSLACKPRLPGAIYAQGKGAAVALPTGARFLHGYLCQRTSGRKLEPAVANVLHRGLIESATRVESLGLAQYLQTLGHRPLQIFADCVFTEVDDDNPLPLLPEPWRSKGILNHWKAVGSNGFMSGELTKIPGGIRNVPPVAHRQRAPRFTLENMMKGSQNAGRY